MIFKSVKDFYKFDMIVINYEILVKIRENLKDKDKVPFLGVFNKCVIKHTDVDENTVGYLYFEDLGDSVIMLKSYVYNTKKKKLLHLFDLQTDYKSNNRLQVKYNLLYMKRESKVNRELTVKKTEAIYMAIFGYILGLQANKNTIVKNTNLITDKNISFTTNHDKQKRNIIQLGGIDIKIASKNSSILKHFKKTHNKYTEAWTVRGHYRTLKDGRKIHVKPYIKGNKDKFKPKDYNIKTS